MTNRLDKVKSFVLPKKERNFFQVFPYSRLQFINGTEDERLVIEETAFDFFKAYCTVLLGMIESPNLGTLKDMKIAFYYMQELSKIIWPRLSYYDPITSLIYTLRTPEFMQERDKEFFTSFPEWIQKLIMILVNSGIEFSNV